MPQVLSLIADPQKYPIGDTHITRVKAGGIATREGRWLAEGEAWEVELHAPPPGLLQHLRDGFADEPVDVNIVPSPARPPGLLIADMDSTMIEQECIDELAEAAGAGPAVRDITARAMNGELDFEDALRARVKTLKGLPLAVIDQVIDERITFAPGARQLVATLRSLGCHCALVSGGFTHFTAHVARALGFHEHQANTLMADNGYLTGSVVEPILGKDAKVSALDSHCRSLGITPAHALAVGDGANDIPMLRAAGLGVAVHARPAVRKAVPVRIDHAGLEALLFLLGIARAKFAQPA